MTRNYTFFLFPILFTLLSSNLFAQNKGIQIFGTIVEKNSGQAVEFATVMVKNKNTEEMIAGVTTDIEGRFSIQSPTPDVKLIISFIGFIEKVVEDISIENGKAELGTILLSEDSETLDEVVVRAEKSSTEFKLDKRVFNVGKDLSSTGSSALEILNNVPSVNVNIEGQITLRGAGGVQILINGKPSVLASEESNALGSITAEMIEKIEVITNPGAKYDAEGTSGIINIIIKKEERKGINGSVSVNTGIPHNHSVGLSLNRRTEKFNLFTQLGAGYRELPSDQRNINRDLVTGSSIISEGKEYRNEVFYNVILGTDYHINKYNVLTLSGSFAYEIEDQPSNNDFRIEDEAGNVISEWYREEVTEATNPKYQYELQYKKDFEGNKDRSLLFSAIGNFFGKAQSSDFENVNIIGNETKGNQDTRTEFKEARTTLKLDYTHPFNKQFAIETGAQYFLNDVSNDYEVNDIIDGQLIQNSNLTNVFEYNQKVLGVYGTGAYEAEKWGLKMGLRVENTDLSTFLVNTGQPNNQTFTNLFPSAHTSYIFSDKFSIQAGYSRRIYRPRMWSLNPFFNIRNNFSVRQGNPDLQPEFTDSYEVGTIYTFDKASFNLNIYHRYTTGQVENVITFENNVSTSFPLNIGTNGATGIELNGKYSPQKWFSVNGDFNFNYFDRKGEFEGQSFDFTNDRWSGKLTTKFKFPAQIDFEVTGQYESGFQTVQGTVSDNLYANLGLRKKILKGKAVINFSVRDVFASRIRESFTNQPTFEIYRFSQRGRFMTLGFSYGFGKGEAMEYSGRRRR
ncbi:MAG: outer membrane receptor protein involved in Fe transport [Saprospiraceae bacterium]|jgi:outer membrane receptor protein involved in Fe transport